MASDQPFRFLDLPAELRCMVYECLNVETRLYTINYSYPFDTSTPVTASIVIKRLSTSILASCHLICAEAATILAPKLKYLRNHEPLHFIVHTLGFDTLFYGRNSVISAIRNQEQYVRFHGKETEWKPYTGHAFTDMHLRPNEKRYALLLKFIYTCANYTRNRHSNKMLVTVKAHPDFCFDSFTSSILGSEYQEEGQRFRDIDEVEMRLWCDKIDVDTCLQTVETNIAPEDFRTIGPWRTTIRGMDDAERNEVCSSGEVIELM
jgi:hypothetical protein